MGFFQSTRNLRLNTSTSNSDVASKNRAFFRNSFRIKSTLEKSRRKSIQPSSNIPMKTSAVAEDTSSSNLRIHSMTRTESSNSITETKDVTMSPKEYLTSVLQSRGFTVQACDALSSGYSQPSSPLQIACFTDYMVKLVKSDDAATLRQLLATDYISFNPANVFGESVASMACRFGSFYILQMLIQEFRVNVSIADSNGRTCLHEACWNAQIQWPIVELLLGSDPHLLFVSDSSGKVPMDYCPSHPESIYGWIQFIDQKKDEYWPMDAETKHLVPPLLQQPSTPYPISDCLDIDGIEHAKLVASGNMHPDQVTKMFRLGTSLDELDIDDTVSACYTSCEDDTEGTEYFSRSRNSFNYDMLESELSEFLDTLDQNFRQMHCKSHSTKHILGRSGEDDPLKTRRPRRETLHL